MSALYATINDCAAKNKPTGRGHRSIAATVKDWEFKIEATLEAAPKGSEVDTWATITVTNLRDGESIEIASDELHRIFKQAKARKDKQEREEAAISKLLLDRETAAFALDAVR